MTELIGTHPLGLAWIAAKAALLFGVALVGLLSARRTLAQLSIHDFVTAVAVGAIVGRVPNASSTSFVAGAVTLTVLLGLHRLLSLARVVAPIGQLLDHPPTVLAEHGAINHAALLRTQLTRGDLAEMLRLRGVGDLEKTDYVIFEPSGQVSVVPQGEGGGLIDEAIAAANHAPSR